MRKSDGSVERFDRGKLARTLIRAGADRETALRIAGEVERRAHPGIETREILEMALEMLEGERPGLAARYDLKSALMRLGPTGYPFERYFARLLGALGYRISGVGMVLPGRCVDQEVDVSAERGGVRYMVECKHHERPGIKTDLKVAMYTRARFEDLEGRFDEPWLATNTKVTAAAERYAGCTGMRLTSWGRSRGGPSLREMVEGTGLYPVTVLRTLDRGEAAELAAAGAVTVVDVVSLGVGGLREMGVGDPEGVLREARGVLSPHRVGGSRGRG